MFLKRGPLGLHGLRDWPILAPRFWDLNLNHAGFWVLRCVTSWGTGHFCARVLGISLKIPILLGFQSKTTLLRRGIMKTGDGDLPRRRRNERAARGRRGRKVLPSFLALRARCAFGAADQSPVLIMPLRRRVKSYSSHS